jgi:hypothetical protein
MKMPSVTTITSRWKRLVLICLSLLVLNEIVGNRLLTSIISSTGTVYSEKWHSLLGIIDLQLPITICIGAKTNAPAVPSVNCVEVPARDIPLILDIDFRTEVDYWERKAMRLSIESCIDVFQEKKLICRIGRPTHIWVTKGNGETEECITKNPSPGKIYRYLETVFPEFMERQKTQQEILFEKATRIAEERRKRGNIQP